MAVESLSNHLQFIRRALEFQADRTSGQVAVTVTDGGSRRAIRRFQAGSVRGFTLISTTTRRE